VKKILNITVSKSFHIRIRKTCKATENKEIFNQLIFLFLAVECYELFQLVPQQITSVFVLFRVLILTERIESKMLSAHCQSAKRGKANHIQPNRVVSQTLVITQIVIKVLHKISRKVVKGYIGVTVF